MKNLVLLLSFLFAMIAQAQSIMNRDSFSVIDSGHGIRVVSLDNGSNFKKNDTVTIVDRITHSKLVVGSDGHEESVLKRYLIIKNRLGIIEEVEYGRNASKRFKLVGSEKDEIWNYGIVTNVLPMLDKKGDQNKLRKEVEDDALEYIARLSNAGLELDDPYLYDYLYSLIFKIAPSWMIDGKPYSINVFVAKDADINACMFPNGTLVINTGLLAVLHSEDELVAVLSHEIAHYVLDHQIKNINERQDRESRTAFWSSFAVAVSAAGSAVLASKTNNYFLGSLMATTSVVAPLVINMMCDRLGCEYSVNQEYEADKYAKEITKVLGYNENALATALVRIADNIEIEKNCSNYFNSQTHPDIDIRINTAGKLVDLHQTKYEKMVSPAVYWTGLIAFTNKRFQMAKKFAYQNINVGTATADDYLLCAYSILYTSDTKESTQEANKCVGLASTLQSENPNLKKAQIIIALRQGKIELAIELLNNYEKSIDGILHSIRSNAPYQISGSYYQFLSTEKTWCQSVLLRVAR